MNNSVKPNEWRGTRWPVARVWGTIMAPLIAVFYLLNLVFWVAESNRWLP